LRTDTLHDIVAKVQMSLKPDGSPAGEYEEASTMAIRSCVPEDCHLRKNGNPSADQLRHGLVTIETYEDDSHLIHTLERCRQCGQLYFYEFYEKVDWVESNDAQYRTWIPVQDAESAQELSKLSPLDLLRFPSIRSDFPSSAQSPTDPKWVVPASVKQTPE